MGDLLLVNGWRLTVVGQKKFSTLAFRGFCGKTRGEAETVMTLKV